MADRNYVVILSDIHMGTDVPTVWYQKRVHEPYLMAVFDDIIKRAESIQELILLGDIFDFWMYPPGMNPPTMDEIISAHPHILGPDGKLSQALSALKGRVAYVPGNHDMNVQEVDIMKIQNPTYKINYKEGVYIPEYAPEILFTHGHECTLFNAPDHTTELAPLPLGHFMSRAISYGVEKKLEQGQTAANLPSQGAPEVGLKQELSLLVDTFISSSTFIHDAMEKLSEKTSCPMDLPIMLGDLYHNEEYTLKEVADIYANLLDTFPETIVRQGLNPRTIMRNGILADSDGLFLPWFAQKLSLEKGAYFAVMGHSHIPVTGLSNGMIDYMNTGFMCPAVPDINKHPITYGTIDLSNHAMYMHQVIAGAPYKIMPLSESLGSITMLAGKDYSCYVTIRNGSQSTAKLSAPPVANHGQYTVLPPEEIEKGKEGRFWLQDISGPFGSEGNVRYKITNFYMKENKAIGERAEVAGEEEILFEYGCPLISDNYARPEPFFATVNRPGITEENRMPTSGNPLIVAFLIEREMKIKQHPYKQGDRIDHNGCDYICIHPEGCENTASSMDDWRFPMDCYLWHENANYTVGYRVIDPTNWNGMSYSPREQEVYECIQEHVSKPGTNPSKSLQYWKKLNIKTGGKG